jgi:hypothetical protein
VELYVPIFWETLSFSAGRLRSFTPAATKHHFIKGAQKKTVLGPEHRTQVYVRTRNASHGS